MSVLDKILEKKEKLDKKGIYCKKCDQWFADRKEFGRHLSKVHKNNAVKPKRFVIPADSVDELKYLSKGSFVRLNVEGTLTEKGVEVSKFKYV